MSDLTCTNCGEYVGSPIADRIEELDGIIRHDRERIEELVSMVNSKDARIEELEAKLGLIQDEWTGAVYGDLENGVASLNAAAASDFYRRYPLVSAFGETLNRIINGEPS